MGKLGKSTTNTDTQVRNYFSLKRINPNIFFLKYLQYNYQPKGMLQITFHTIVSSKILKYVAYNDKTTKLQQKNNLQNIIQ